MNERRETMYAKEQGKTKPEVGNVGGRPAYARRVVLPGTDAMAALARATNAFGREGFGVVGEFDLRAILRTQVDKEVSPYWILDFCNPNLADRVLAVDRDAGLLPPCRVAVWQEGKAAVVAVLRPEVVAGIAQDENLTAIALEAERHVERALVHLEAPERELPITD
jgi:uncharacterized protein (DUF302 family)